MAWLILQRCFLHVLDWEFLSLNLANTVLGFAIMRHEADQPAENKTNPLSFVSYAITSYYSLLSFADIIKGMQSHSEILKTVKTKTKNKHVWVTNC